MSVTGDLNSEEMSDCSSLEEGGCIGGEGGEDRGGGGEGGTKAASGCPTSGRRRRANITNRDRNVRRIESNERERVRMHELNDAFQVAKLL